MATTRITTNLCFAEQLHPKPTAGSLCWVQELLQTHVAMHRSEAKTMPSHLWAPTKLTGSAKTRATASSQLSYCKAQLAASEKGLDINCAKLKCPLFPEEESSSSKQSNWTGRVLQTAQPNCSCSHQPSEEIQRLQNIRTALKGFKTPAIFSFSEMLFKTHKKEMSFDWTFLHFRPMAAFLPPQEFKAVSRGKLCISKIFLKAKF